MQEEEIWNVDEGNFGFNSSNVYNVQKLIEPILEDPVIKVESSTNDEVK